MSFGPGGIKRACSGKRENDAAASERAPVRVDRRRRIMTENVEAKTAIRMAERMRMPGKQPDTQRCPRITSFHKQCDLTSTRIEDTAGRTAMVFVSLPWRACAIC